MIADAAILISKVSLQAKQLLPEYSGIYYVLDETNVIWYIGKATNIRKRWQGKAHHRIYQLEAHKKKCFTIYCEPVSRTRLDEVEKQRIEKYQPHLNASPVKTKKVRPTETLLRETIAAIADFAFILGVEPPRKEVASQIGNYRLNLKQALETSIIHICLDEAALDTIYQPESIEESVALQFKAFVSRKAYASKWEFSRLGFIFVGCLLVNGYAIEVAPWHYWYKDELEGLREYTQASLAQESIKALTPESLVRLQKQVDEESSAFYVQRLNPYTCDPIKLLFNEPLDSKAAKEKLAKISEDYKKRRRGVGSRLKTINIDQLLVRRGIDPQKYSSGVLPMQGHKIGTYVQCFSVDAKKLNIYSYTFGMLNGEEKAASSGQFNTVYLLAGVERKAWLLVEEYFKDFVKPATNLNEGEGYIRKLRVSARKFVVPAKVNIKLENLGYSAWIPFGTDTAFTTYETAK